jgi:ParB-like chromosome segregation protein Spo0J
MSHTITLRNKAQADSIIRKAAEWIGRRVADGRAVVLTLEDERRNLDQNALLHALLTDISHRHEWAGRKRDAECWKRLFVAAWCRARGEAVEMLPALDGHGVDIVFRRTSKMSKAEVSELIDYIQAWDEEA